jgi:hypothetical protein
MEQAGPSHQPIARQNVSFESSLRVRIINLENDQTLFLLDKEKGQYWRDIKADLDQAYSQREYNQLLYLLNMDLQIRELKHSCYSLFQQVLSAHPDLAERACYNPCEALMDFFEERRDELDTRLSVEKRDGEEILFLHRVAKDLKQRGRASPYINQILELEWPYKTKT